MSEKKYDIKEAFTNAKSFEVGAFYRSKSGSISLLLSDGVTLSGTKDGIVVNVEGLSRPASGGMFVNKLSDTIEFLTGRGDVEGAERVTKRMNKGITSVLKANLGE